MTPCLHCKYRSRLWGIWYCLLDKWAGILNEKKCDEYDEPREITQEEPCKR
jgi:hypothetical protein